MRRTCPGCGFTSIRAGKHINRCVWLINLDQFLAFGDVDAADLTACWMWRPNKHRTDAYGQFTWDRSHRQAYRVAFKVEPGKLDVCHSCDRPGCVNPAHLFLGTASDNIRDAVDKGRVRSPMLNPIYVEKMRQTRLAQEMTKRQVKVGNK